MSALDALVSAEAGVSAVVGARDPWVFMMMRGFAGPSTDWRAVALADEPGWEAVGFANAIPADNRPGFAGAGIPGRAHGVRRGDTFEVGTDGIWQPAAALRVENEQGRRTTLLASAGGVTLGELLDETAAQRAQLDASYVVHILAALLPTFLGRGSESAAISVDNVLLGFDGSILCRADVPWWPRRRAARLEPGFLTPTDDAESLRLVGELAAELFASKRWDVRAGLSFPGHEGVLRKEARSFVEWLLQTPVRPDLEELWLDVDVPPLLDVAARIEVLRRLVDPVTPLALATLVRHLFPVRARREEHLVELLQAIT